VLETPHCYIRKCKHFKGIKDKGSELSQVVYCDAFPDGIPSEISYGKVLHFDAYAGDNGIQFEKEGEL